MLLGKKEILMNKIVFSADDLGASISVNDSIFETCDTGAIDKVSILVTKPGTEDAIKRLEKRSNVRKCLHLDLTEGRSLSGSSLLKKKNYGNFKLTFVGLLIRSLFIGSKSKFWNSVTLEIEEQIKYFKEVFPKESLFIDGHQHIHVIPKVLSIIISMSEKYSIDYIRLPRENFFVSVSKFSDLKNYFGPNLLKSIILKFLSFLAIKKILAKKIDFNDSFLGILFSGNMNPGSVRDGLLKQEGRIEVLFHPGFAPDIEKNLWAGSLEFFRFYNSKKRLEEKDYLISGEIHK